MSNDRRIDYIEFQVRDLTAAKAFYGRAFGWKFTDWGEDYTSFEDGRLTGGFLRTNTPAVSTGNPLVVLYAADLVELEGAIVAAGGVVTARHEFPGGRRFHFKDPQGNHLAVWTDRP